MSLRKCDRLLCLNGTATKLDNPTCCPLATALASALAATLTKKLLTGIQRFLSSFILCGRKKEDKETSQGFHSETLHKPQRPRAHRRANSTWRRTNKMDVNPDKRDIFVFGYSLESEGCRAGETDDQRFGMYFSLGKYDFICSCYRRKCDSRTHRKRMTCLET